MSGAHSHDNMVPPVAIAMGGMLVVASVALVIGVRADVLPARPTPAEIRQDAQVRPVAQRRLFFADQNGFVRVTDASSGAEVAMIGQEGSGFIRGVMRGLARERRMHGLGAATPFALTLHSNTELVLTDLGTGREIQLSGFGDTNRQAFLRLLEAR